jgi:hypothetical protein
MTVEATNDRKNNVFAMTESIDAKAVSNPHTVVFTNTARAAMEDLHASEETIRECIAQPDAVRPAFAREPGETVVQITTWT